MRMKLIIELRSDLCAGNGKGFAQVIDIDTAIDACGIPYIPGRRIKGCLRELAGDVFREDQKTVGRIFGVSGSNRAGTLTIGDGRIKDYDVKMEQVRRAIAADRIKPNDITDLFCSVRSATALENETVKDGSLRFVRVVNRLSPIDHSPMRFYADISFDEDDQETVFRLVKGLRNIGYHRNRGLGSVKCILENVGDYEAPDISQDGGRDKKNANVLEYLLYLESDLMLPASDVNHSLDYIPGTSALGAFAGRYLKQFGEDGFSELFLSGQVRFSNLYISDYDGTDYLPAPAFLAKIKAAGKGEGSGIHNQVSEEHLNEERRRRGEEIPQYKPLKRGYFNWEKGYKEPDTEIVYHNTINSEESGLYTQYCISAGQYFKGRIETSGRLLDKLDILTRDGVLYFGRSKTSQYARCRIIAVNRSVARPEKVKLEEGKTAAFLCESDIVLLHEGRYTVDLNDLCKELEKVAGICIPFDSLSKFTNITSKIVSGYNAKWNLKKPQFPAIKAGSVVLFRVDELKTDLENRYIIGVKQNEGYGCVRLLADVEALEVSNRSAEDSGQNEEVGELLSAVEERKENDRILEDGITLAARVSKAPFNSSQIGRLMLMCKESADYDDFMRRINSIKTDETREKALSCFDRKKVPEKLKKEWKKQQKLFITALTVSKYDLRSKGESDA